MKKFYTYKRFKYSLEEFNKLKNDLIEWNNAYYDKSSPLVSDQVFDAHLNILKGLEIKYPELEDENSPTKRVGH